MVIYSSHHMNDIKISRDIYGVKKFIDLGNSSFMNKNINSLIAAILSIITIILNSSLIVIGKMFRKKVTRKVDLKS
ncbi:hypothetical protein [Azospirillum doebereinerae]